MSKIRGLILFALIGATSVICGQAPQEASSDEIIAVEFCELVRHPNLYAGKTIRVRASWATTFEWSFLYDMGCHSNGTVVDAILDCPNAKLSNTSCETLKANGFATDEKGNPIDGTRAEFILVGVFMDQRKIYNSRLNGSYPFTLLIKSIKDFKRIPSEVPWP